MQKSCIQCSANFQVSEADLAFYDKVSPVFDGKKMQIPLPKMCPMCRQQRRLSFRNERKLYTRKSDMSGRSMISIYSPEKPYKVYDQDEWWSDKWEALDYGREFDFARNFADQFRELYVDVPRVSLHTINNENSYYTCYTLNLKNCYLIFGAGDDEDCIYGKYVAYCKDMVDGLSVYSCEMCYEGTASDGCYNCKFFTNSRNCSDCLMIEDCGSCKNCIGCFGLRNKEYYLFNKFVGEEKYKEFAKQCEVLTNNKIEYLRAELDRIKDNMPHIQAHIYASEGCTGDAIFNSKNCNECFDVKSSEDCKFLYNAPKSVCTYDGVYCAPEGLQFCYNNCSTVASNSMTTFFVWYCDGIYYSMDCVNSKNLFGCVGLKNKQYCVFNKQYSQEDYEVLVAKIIDHMQKTGEWGEYFPAGLSPFAYNETVAQEYFPLDEEGALRIGSSWCREIVSNEKVSQDKVLEDIREVGDDICERTLQCEVSGKKYKILPQELKFYRKMGLPIPLKSPDQRHFDRLKIHGSKKTFERKCDKCQKLMRSVYDGNQKFAVYCEECYLQDIY